MRKNLITLAAAALLILILYGAIATSLRSFLPPGRLRVLIVEPLEQKLGRKIETESIKVSFIDGITLNNIVIADTESGKNLLTIDQLRFKLQLLPLLKRKLIISKITINQPRLSLTKERDGYLDYLLNNRNPKPPGEKNLDFEPLPVHLAVTDIDIIKAQTTFTDLSGRLPRITDSQTDISVETYIFDTGIKPSFRGKASVIANGSFLDNKPVLFLQGEFDGDRLTFQGNLNINFEQTYFNGRLDHFLSPSPALKLNIKAGTVDLKQLARIQFPSAATLDRSSFEALGKVSISEITGSKAKLTSTRFFYQYKDQTLSIKRLKANSLGGVIDGQCSVKLSDKNHPFQGDLTAKGLKLSRIAELTGIESGLDRGSVSGSLLFSGRSNQWPKIWKELQLSGGIDITEGRLKRPLSEGLADFLTLPALKSFSPRKTTAEFAVNGGLIQIKKLKMTGDAMNLTGRGVANLEGRIIFPLSLEFSKQDAELLKKTLPADSYFIDRKGTMTLSLKLRGTCLNPAFSFDPKGLIRARQLMIAKAAQEAERAADRGSDPKEPAAAPRTSAEQQTDPNATPPGDKTTESKSPGQPRPPADDLEKELSERLLRELTPLIKTE